MSLYLQETLKIAPKLQREYMKHAEREYIPVARAAGLRPQGFWRVASFKGEPSEIIALWELDGWDTVASLNDAVHGAGSGAPGSLAHWYESSARWVRRRAADAPARRACGRLSQERHVDAVLLA